MIPGCWPRRWKPSWSRAPNRPPSIRSTCVWTWATTTPPVRTPCAPTSTSRICAASGRRSWTCSPACHAFPLAAGMLKGPSHNTYNALLTSKPPAPMIGVAGLLNLLEVVNRLQAAQQDCACAPQEGGVPCPPSPLHPSSNPALPPAHEGATAQSVGPVAHSQPATTPPSAKSPRRTADASAGTTSGRRQRGGYA